MSCGIARLYVYVHIPRIEQGGRDTDESISDELPMLFVVRANSPAPHRSN